MENELVFTQWEKILTDSTIISWKLEISHKHLLESIRKLIIDLDNLVAETSSDKNYIFIKESTFKDKRWKEWPMFILNKPAFSLLMMRLSWKKVFKFQESFNKAFYEMEQIILQHQNASWIKSRDEWKVVRLQETDKIQEFIEYAKTQWSNNSNFYYKHITNATYKALELLWENQPIRDTLNNIWLWMLWIAELKVINSLDKWMKQWLHYKEIFLLAKQDLEELAKILPKFDRKFIN